LIEEEQKKINDKGKTKKGKKRKTKGKKRG
jgi:hypothetical protein